MRRPPARPQRGQISATGTAGTEELPRHPIASKTRNHVTVLTHFQYEELGLSAPSLLGFASMVSIRHLRFCCIFVVSYINLPLLTGKRGY
jgi:hypothetical protein